MIDPKDLSDKLMSAKVEGDELVIRLPLDLLVWAQQQREDSILINDVRSMGAYLENNILDWGGDPEIGSTAFEDFLDALFMDAVENAEPWLDGWWSLEEDND